MRLFDWLRPPHYLLALFLVVTLVPAAAIVWLGMRILRQDRALERQQVQDRLERDADGVAAALGRELNALDQRLDDLLTVPDGLASAGALVVVLAEDGVRAHVGAPLVFVPSVRAIAEPDPSTWRRGETSEFSRNDPVSAAVEFEGLAKSTNPQVRAGALVRFARTLRKTRRREEALDVYARLGELGAATVEGEPAALVARDARCRLLGELGRTADLARERAALAAYLASGRVPIARDTFEFYARELADATGAVPATLRESAALAGAVSQLASQLQADRRSDAAGRRSVRIDGTPLLIVGHPSSSGFIALVAAPRFVDTTWPRIWSADRETTLIDADGYVVRGGGNSGGPGAVRSALDTRLPWTIRLTSTASAAESGIARPRRLLQASLALIAFLVVAGSIVVIRAVRQELAVARLQSDFVSAVSHEFRTPLTSIAHLTEMLRTRDTIGDDRRRQYYDVLAHETDRLRRFVETLLDFGRMEAGASAYQFEPLDPRGIVSRAVEEFRGELPRDGARAIAVKPHGEVPAVRGDRDALALALRNLLDNAAKYSSDEIDVELAREGDEVAVAVRDRGPGIPANEHQRIFQKFVRGAATRGSNIRGTGVGLAMVRHIARAHGGDVRLESEIGRGSTFTLLLPVEKSHA
jgi:signal transduction histidine kinase